jgi:hypothetical protein
MENNFGDIDTQDIWNIWEQDPLWQNIHGEDIVAQFLSAPSVSMVPADGGCSMTKLDSCRRWLKLATLVKSMAMLKAWRSKG